MRQITIIFFYTIFLSSCACLKKEVNENRIPLAESNLTLLDGKYERKSLPRSTDSLFIDLYSTLYADLYSHHLGNKIWIQLKNDTSFLELKVINKNRIRVSYMNESDIIDSKIMKGKIKNGYFEFRRRYFIVPIVILNLFRNSKTRIGLLNDNNLIVDGRNIAFGTIMVLFPFFHNDYEQDIIFQRIEIRIE